MEGNMITQLWELVSQAIVGFVQAIVSAFNGITEIFYLEATGFTFLGQLMFIALAMSIVYFAFRFIRNLIRNR